MFSPEVEVSDVDVDLLIEYLDTILEMAGVTEIEVEEELVEEIIEELEWTREYEDIFFTEYI